MQQEVSGSIEMNKNIFSTFTVAFYCHCGDPLIWLRMIISINMMHDCMIVDDAKYKAYGM